MSTEGFWSVFVILYKEISGKERMAYVEGSSREERRSCVWWGIGGWRLKVRARDSIPCEEREG
jgi:hypothetical protein